VRRWLVLAVLLAAGCGNAPASASHPAPSGGAAGARSSPSADTGPAGETLFAVLEPGGDFAQMRNDVVAIVRPNGVARARATFKRRQLPRMRAALTLPQPEARVADGKVFYADGGGTVRSLAVDGSVSEVTAFPLTDPQQALSFAVSPDGSQLMGAILQYPPYTSSLSPTSDPAGGGSGFSLQLLAATPGAEATSVLTKSWQQSGEVPGDVLSMVGWSSSSALATIDTDVAMQQRTEGRRMFGHVADIDRSGKPGLTVGGSDCRPWTILPDETALCDDGGYQNVSIRSRGGGVLFQLPQSPGDQYVNLTLSPDAARVGYQTPSGSGFVLDRTGNRTPLPAGFQPQGWLDSSTLIGAVGQGSGDMALVRLGNPARAVDLGFKGFFVGALPGA
jgi:hypothetical protein